MTEWNARDYSRQSSLQQSMAEEQLAILQIHGSERVLDIGCGDGKITAEIAARLPQGSVLGVDPSYGMIAFAAKQFASANHANLRFEVADARSLRYRNEFDLIVSFNALHWVPDQDAVLGSIHAALKPTGRALLRFVPEGSRKCLEDVIEETRKNQRWAKFFEGFERPYVHLTPEAYRQLAMRHQLRVLRMQVQDKAWDFKTRGAFVAFARATFVEWTRRLPENTWLEFITDVLDAYQQVAAERPDEANTFKFYQMDVELIPGC